MKKKAKNVFLLILSNSHILIHMDKETNFVDKATFKNNCFRFRKTDDIRILLNMNNSIRGKDGRSKGLMIKIPIIMIFSV